MIGSLVSEGIVAYRVDAGQLPVSDRHLTDVGPSYVVISAIVVAILCGAWAARILAVIDLAHPRPFPATSSAAWAASTSPPWAT